MASSSIDKKKTNYKRSVSAKKTPSSSGNLIILTEIPEIKKTLGQVTTSFNYFLSNLQTATKGLADQLGPFLELGRVLTAPGAQEEIFEALFKDELAVVREAAKLGWLLPGDDLDIANILTIDDFIDPAIANNKMIEYIQDNLSNIQLHLISRYPHREQILTDAFEAHFNGKYTLSIPTLHAQADGMFQDKTDWAVFGSNNIIKSAGKTLKLNKVSQLDKLLLKMLIESPLTKSGVSLKPGSPSPMHANRHSVLHGNSTSYASLEHSCRVIAYLTFIDYLTEQSTILTSLK